MWCRSLLAFLGPVRKPTWLRASESSRGCVAVGSTYHCGYAVASAPCPANSRSLSGRRRVFGQGLVLLLIGAAINVPLAIHGTRLQPAWLTPARVDRKGPAAQAEGWPIRPPTPWPAVTEWSQDVDGAAIRRTAWSQNQQRRTTHQMEVLFYGWPLPSIHHAMIWSSADHSPRYVPPIHGADGAQGMDSGTGTGNEFHDAGLQLHWPGVILNPLLFAVVAWLLLVAPILAFFAARRALRRRRGCCPACGYPIGDSERCSECGAATSGRSPALVR